MLAIVCVVLSGCTASADGDGPKPDGTQADAFFVHRMIEHGKQAAEAAKLVEGRTTNATVIRLGKEILDAATAETPQLTALSGKWGDKPAGSSESIPGAIKPDKIATLSGTNGRTFTSGWLDTMIVHHRGAITMAETELAQGKDADTRALAQKIIGNRQPQLDQMQGMTGG